jgi:hypothetical protein
MDYLTKVYFLTNNQFVKLKNMIVMGFLPQESDQKVCETPAD